MRSVPSKFLSLLAPLAVLVGCDADKTTGTVDETNHAASAVVYSSEGKPVAQALVQVFRREDTTRQATATVLTGDDGSYVLPTLENGLYRVIARKGAQVGVQDSVYAVSGKTTAKSDTIKDAPVASGVVKMVGDDNPASVLVQVQGTDVLVNVDSDGRFALNALGAGTYTLRLSTALEGYTVTAKQIRIVRGQETKLDTIAMNYSDVLPVANFRAVVDPLSGEIVLRWDAPSQKGVRDVLISRVLKSSSDPAQVIGNSDSAAYHDKEFVGRPTAQTWLYTAQVRMLDGRMGRVAYVTVMQPGGLAPTLRYGLVNRSGQFDSSLGFACKPGDTLRFRAVARSGVSPIAGISTLFPRFVRPDTLLKNDSSWILQWTLPLDSSIHSFVSDAKAWDKAWRKSDSVWIWVHVIDTVIVQIQDSTKPVPTDSVRPVDSSSVVTDVVRDTTVSWTFGKADTASCSVLPGLVDSVWMDSNAVTIHHAAGCGILSAKLDTGTSPATLSWTLSGGGTACATAAQHVRTRFSLGAWASPRPVFWNGGSFRKAL